MKPTLNGRDFARAAGRLGCEIEAIEAVAEVESRGSGFNPDDSPKTLFEGHIFHRLTGGRFGNSHPTLSYPTWRRDFYGRTWQDEQYRLQQAMQLDERAALMATSWGRFQVMGFNHGAAGFTDLQAFVDAMRESESRQLDAFVEFILTNGLADELREKRWADFARSYNGRDYAKNHYDEKLAKAYDLAVHNRKGAS